jgi:hypothetical protein
VTLTLAKRPGPAKTNVEALIASVTQGDGHLARDAALEGFDGTMPADEEAGRRVTSTSSWASRATLMPAMLSALTVWIGSGVGALC